MDKDMQLLDPRAMTAAKEMGITVAPAKDTATAAGMSVGPYLGYEDTPAGVLARHYVKGHPPVTHAESPRLSTHLPTLPPCTTLQPP